MICCFYAKFLKDLVLQWLYEVCQSYKGEYLCKYVDVLWILKKDMRNANLSGR